MRKRSTGVNKGAGAVKVPPVEKKPRKEAPSKANKLENSKSPGIKSTNDNSELEASTSGGKRAQVAETPEILKDFSEMFEMCEKETDELEADGNDELQENCEGEETPTNVDIEETSTNGINNSATDFYVKLDPEQWQTIVEMNIKLDHLMKMTKKPDGTAPKSAKYDLGFTFPLKEKPELDELNNKLKGDQDFHDKFVQKFSEINGVTQDPPIDGIKAAYKLIDSLLTRALILNFTWTGAGTSDDKNSYSFSKYSAFLNAFKDIVMLRDDRYSVDKNEKFFKDSILKHRVARAQQKKVNAINDD
ncbi:hypothetical protein DMENIID0001_170690 [Sergentomyia squamirostris]